MDFFSQAQVDALRRLKDAFEQKLLDEDEYKAEKAKVLNNAAAAPAPPAPPPASDDADFELVGVQTPAERAAESRRRAEAEGNVLEIDDNEPAAPAPAPSNENDFENLYNTIADRFTNRARGPNNGDIMPLNTAEKAAVLHAIAQLDGKATQRKVRRAAESALGAPEGALDAKKAAVKELCELEMSRQSAEAHRAHRDAVANFPGTQPRDEGRWVRGAFTGAPPPPAPKPKAKKLSGFMLFSKEMRPKVIADGQGLSFGDISKRLGELWRGLPDAEKARYNRTCVPA